jgi:hypothetical protein
MCGTGKKRAVLDGSRHRLIFQASKRDQGSRADAWQYVRWISA